MIGDIQRMAVSTRQQAIELTRSYAITIFLAHGKPVDFYKLLWVVHWAIEHYGREKTDQALADILMEPDFDSDTIAARLREHFLEYGMKDSAMGSWFARAMKA